MNNLLTFFYEKRFQKNKTAVLALCTFIFLLLVAILAPVIANKKPLYASYKNTSLFPAFSFKKNIHIKNEILNYETVDWKTLACDKIFFAPIPYSPTQPDYYNDYTAPFSDQAIKNGNSSGRFRHWLGTDKLGRDVLAGLIHGTRISLAIGVFSMLIAALIGISLGAIAGYFGDRQLKISRGIFFMLITGLITGFFYAFQTRYFLLVDSLQESLCSFLVQLCISLVLFLMVMLLFYFSGKLLSTISFLRKEIFIPIDFIVSRCIEILISLPRLILILSIAAIARPTLFNLAVIIGLTSWTEIARLTRAEFLKLRNYQFIEAAKALGYSNRRIIFFHALPNGIAPALVAIAFGIASAILAESSLSFLGVGVPQDVVTWGSLLSQGRENFNAWWLVVFPGLAIFITVTIYNLLGEGLRDAFDVKDN